MLYKNLVKVFKGRIYYSHAKLREAEAMKAYLDQFEAY